MDVDDVDVARTLRDALLDDAQPFVDQREDEPVDDLVGGDRPPLDTELARAALHDREDPGVGTSRAPRVIVAIETGAALLTEPAHFDERVGHAERPRIAAHRFRQRLPRTPGDVDPGEIGDRERAHRESEIGERRIDAVRRAAFEQAQLRLPHVASQHAIADEAVGIARQHRHLADLLRQRHAGGEHVVGRLPTPARPRATS